MEVLIIKNFLEFHRCYIYLFFPAKMGSQVLVPFRGSEDSHRHLKLMGDLGQVHTDILCSSKLTFFGLSSFCLSQILKHLYLLYLICSDSADAIQSKRRKLYQGSYGKS